MYSDLEIIPMGSAFIAGRGICAGAGRVCDLAARSGRMCRTIFARITAECTRTLRAGPLGRIGEGARWKGTAAPRFGFTSECN
jgi:hypothetical protein